MRPMQPEKAESPKAILNRAKLLGAIRDWMPADNGFYVWHHPPLKARLYDSREVVALASMKSQKSGAG